MIITVHVKLHARASVLEAVGDGVWLARLCSPPVNGKANDELRTLVALQFKCPRSAVSIKRGATSRIKQVEIT